jgi:hypothetical protein
VAVLVSTKLSTVTQDGGGSHTVSKWFFVFPTTYLDSIHRINAAIFRCCSDAHSQHAACINLLYHVIFFTQPPPLDAQFGSEYLHYHLQRRTIWKAWSTWLSVALRAQHPKNSPQVPQTSIPRYVGLGTMPLVGVRLFFERIAPRSCGPRKFCQEPTA